MDSLPLQFILMAFQAFASIDVRVKIDRSRLKKKRGQYDYVSLTGEMLDVTLVVRYKSARVRASMRLIEEMNYPLMFIEEIEKK